MTERVYAIELVEGVSEEQQVAARRVLAEMAVRRGDSAEVLAGVLEALGLKRPERTLSDLRTSQGLSTRNRTLPAVSVDPGAGNDDGPGMCTKSLHEMTPENTSSKGQCLACRRRTAARRRTTIRNSNSATGVGPR